jgi:Fe-Mn family superoxide dismutase
MRPITRRQALQTAVGLGSVAFGTAALVGSSPSILAQGAQPPAGPFTLPRLPYAFDALQPSIDARTMEIHHDRHHQAYVNNLNTAVQGQPIAKQPIEQILRNINNVPMQIRQAVINNGGGHYNHSMFWTIMAAGAGGAPPGDLASAINASFTSFDNFKTQFKTACLGRFGSGWGWLVKREGRLEITTTANQDCPLMSGQLPILGLDVWEHAYYLHYQNRRNDYIDAFWNVVSWPAVAQRFAMA